MLFATKVSNKGKEKEQEFGHKWVVKVQPGMKPELNPHSFINLLLGKKKPQQTPKLPQ